MQRRPATSLLIAMISFIFTATYSHGAEERPIDVIKDNSFLIEEAYNQEAGVVQHIFTALYARDNAGADRLRAWEFTFTQEWPIFSGDHQFSYTIPYSFIDLWEDGERDKENGLGDIFLNYRYQLLHEKPWL